MAQDEQVLLISDRLEAFELKTLLQPGARPGARDPSRDGQPVPISPDGSLAPEVLYEASDDARVRCYLPRYVLRTVGERHTSRLRLRTATDDPHGPLGWLSLELLALAPVDSRFPLREIPHSVTLRLAHRLPIEAAPGSATVAIAAAWDGHWINTDAATRGMTRLHIGTAADGRLSLRGFGRCHPADCDWGEVTARTVADGLEALYNFGFKTTRIRLRRVGAQIDALVTDDFSDSDGRADRETRYTLAREGRAAAESPLVWDELGPASAVAPQVLRCVLPFHAQADYDRMHQILATPQRQAQIEIRCHATLGQRSWQQWWIKRPRVAPGLTDRRDILVNPALLRSVRSSLADGLALQESVQQPLVFNPGLVRPMPLERGAVERLTTPHIPVQERLLERASFGLGSLKTRSLNRRLIDATALAQPRSVMHAPPAAPAAVTIAPPISLTIDRASVASLLLPSTAPAVLDAAVRTPAASGQAANLALLALGRDSLVKSLPQHLVVDPQGRPVLVRREVDAVQLLAPALDPVRDAYLFDAPLNPAANHVLFQHDLSLGERTLTFFQDSLKRDQIYYEPQEFRLARSDSAPYLPGLLFAISDVVSEDSGVQYRVRLAFNALPHIDPLFLLLARQTFGPAARFTALSPRAARLSLRLPTADGQPAPLEPRPDASVSFDDGIRDELSLDEQQFVRLAAAFQTPEGVGLQGNVNATLTSGEVVDIPLRLSLKDNGGTPFGPALLSPGSAGDYSLTLRNRIESPVRLKGLHPVPLGHLPLPDGTGTQPVLAQALDLPPQEPVAPGQTVVLRYRVSPTDAPVAVIPPSIDSEIEPDLPLLLGRLTVTEALSENTFAVDVSINPLFLGVGGVTGVVVEIENGPTLTLDAQTLSVTVALRKSLLARILNLDPLYRYRVTRLQNSGTNAPGEWQSHTGNLQIVLV